MDVMIIIIIKYLITINQLNCFDIILVLIY